MQLDMHYYGTYAMARAAGIKPEHAQAIATAAQYVDDSDTAAIELRDGAFLVSSATAHHPVDAQNIDPHDQRQVWIPFHFLPGNEGSSFAERLVCRTDSTLAREAIEHALSHANESYGPMLMGVVAHVYADTFSHYGFSGIASDVNGVDSDSITPRITSAEMLGYVTSKACDFFEKRKADAANLLKLGHGSVATYPDRPYLRWDFQYSDGRSSGERDNPTTFLLACEKLHAMFRRLGDVAPQYLNSDAVVPFDEIRAHVAEIIRLEGSMDDRIAAWRTSAATGKLFRGADAIPAYQADRFGADLARLGSHSSEEARATFLFRFLQAAKRHRDFVLDELLPRHGLQVVLP